MGEKIHCGVKTRWRCNPRPSCRSPPLPLLFLFLFFFLFFLHFHLGFLFNLSPSTSAFTLSNPDTSPKTSFWPNAY